MPSSAKINEIIQSDNLILIDFYATWCTPCKLMAKILGVVEKSFSRKIKVLQVDVDKYAELSEKYDVQGLPTLVLFHKGEIIWRRSGVLPQDYLMNELNQTISLREKRA